MSVVSPSAGEWCRGGGSVTLMSSFVSLLVLVSHGSDGGGVDVSRCRNVVTMRLLQCYRHASVVSDDGEDDEEIYATIRSTIASRRTPSPLCASVHAPGQLADDVVRSLSPNNLRDTLPSSHGTRR